MAETKKEIRKPETVSQYLDWLKNEHEITIDDHYREYYETIVIRLRKDFENSDFWKIITEQLPNFDEEYQLKKGYPLFTPKFEPELLTKNFDSFLLKTFRRNILENQSFPNSPKGGWYLPNNWLEKVNDILRTLFVVKYLDGVEFLNDKIAQTCMTKSMYFRNYFEAREEGYYAVHLYTKAQFEIPNIKWDSLNINLSIEIQITTQLQEVIRKLLHSYYEKRRKSVLTSEKKWQWNYSSDEFSTNYLGHILHYVEGMIMEIREKQEGTS